MWRGAGAGQGRGLEGVEPSLERPSVLFPSPLSPALFCLPLWSNLASPKGPHLRNVCGSHLPDRDQPVSVQPC